MGVWDEVRRQGREYGPVAWDEGVRCVDLWAGIVWEEVKGKVCGEQVGKGGTGPQAGFDPPIRIILSLWQQT